MRNKILGVRGLLAMTLPAMVPAMVWAQPLVLERAADQASEATASTSDAPPAPPAVEPVPPGPAAPAPAVAAEPAPAPAAPPSVVIEPAPAPAATAAPQVAPQPVPAPAPQAVSAAPTDPRLSDGRIVVMRFQPVNPGETNPWVGRSIQESLIADLTVAAPARVESVDEVATTVDAALAAGRDRHARFVIAGGFVTMDRDLRITGQILDIETGRAVGGLKATGQPSQIFHLEDNLAAQVRAQILPAPQQSASEQPASTPAPSTGVRTDDDSYSAQNAPSSRYSNTYSTAPASSAYGSGSTTYTYTPGYYDAGTYTYPDYGYDSGWSYPGVGLYIGGGFGRPFFRPPLRGAFHGGGFIGSRGVARGPMGGGSRGPAMSSRGGAAGGHAMGGGSRGGGHGGGHR